MTFGPDGDVLGGYGPVGAAVEDRTVRVVDVAAALRRLTLVETLSGYPTTISVPVEAVTLVAVDLALSLREASDADGSATGDTWLLPVYRFVDALGDEHEINAVVVDELRVD